MKKYANKLLAVSLVVFALLAFSSCHSDDDDYFWRKGTLDISFDLYPSTNNGYVETTTTVYIDEIPEFNPNREDLMDLVTNDSWLTLSNFLRGDYIDRFYIDVDGVGTYSYEYTISIRYDGEEIVIDDNSYFNFMRNVNDRLYRYGYVNMRIRMYTGIYDRGPVYLDIQNNLDLEIMH